MPCWNIPNNIEVDLKGLDIGASVKISSVKLPDNTSPTITDRDFVVATIAPPTIVKEPEKTTEETAEGAEGEAAKKEEKGKEAAGGDKKPAGKPAGEKK